MKQKKLIKAMIPLYILAAMIMLGIGLAGSRSVTVLSETAPMENRVCVIIDAGHPALKNTKNTIDFKIYKASPKKMHK